MSERIAFAKVADWVFRRGGAELPVVDEDVVAEGHRRFLARAEGGEPVYGVTTGFGDSCFRRIPFAKSEELQRNLVSYLLCGGGPKLPREAVRAMTYARLVSLGRGLSGVSPVLVGRLRHLLEKDWLPAVPREGSLGASGDLIPLAYLARAVQGEGELETAEGPRPAGELLPPYRLKPKEGLALVNGTSAMAGTALVCTELARFQAETACIASAWLCLGLEGRTQPFGPLVNETAKGFAGQSRAARLIRLALGDYVAPERDGGDRIQDRYSLRCSPQILGPVLDTIALAQGWIEEEINGVSDNPLVAADGSLETGGNFYGGYLAHAMDYLKISIGHLSDLADRQIALIIDESTNRGLPPNLSDWGTIPAEDRALHHGLKGLHQAVSAVTGEILSRTMPSSVFSRSTESHNQDKVSMGMSAATAAYDLVEAFFRVQAMHVATLAQALDLRGRAPTTGASRELYRMVRETVPFVSGDRPLDGAIANLAERLKRAAKEKGRWFNETA